MDRGARSVIVAIAICSWLAITNHCAVAALATRGARQPASDQRQDADATECPFHSQPSKEKQQSSQVQCCKILRAVVLEKATSWTRDHAKFSDIDLRIESFVVFAQSRTDGPLLLDTGPPVALSFAELTLQRSLLAHAPPGLA
jgi:hypothetical protein